MTPPVQQTFSQPLRAYVALILIIFAAATGPIVIRTAQQAGAPSLYIIAVRLIVASLILAPVALKRNKGQIAELSGQAWLLIIASSLMFILNLLLLFVSLEYTSVLIVSVMRRTTPLWVIWLEILFFGAIFTRSVWTGLALTLLGSIMVGLGSSSAIEAGSNPLLGTALALLGSVSIGLYLLIGRRFSQLLSPLVYSWLVFTGAAVIAVVAVIAFNIPLTGYSLTAYFWILIVTIITQFLGHIPINVGLHYFPATYISLVLQVAVVVSAVLAFLIFNEVPSILQMIGSGAIMLGIMLVSWK